MLVLLLVGGFVYLFFGDLIEVLVLFVFVIFLVVVIVIQEICIENVLEVLCDFLVLCVFVIWDGVCMCIVGCEVVWDDLIVIEQGDCIVVDVVLIEVIDF